MVNDKADIETVEDLKGADQDVDSVYHFVKAIDEQYDQYKDKTIMLSEYILDNVLTEPLAVSFH